MRKLRQKVLKLRGKAEIRKNELARSIREDELLNDLILKKLGKRVANKKTSVGAVSQSGIAAEYIFKGVKGIAIKAFSTFLAILDKNFDISKIQHYQPPTKRVVSYGSIHLDVYCAKEGLDRRCDMWKKDALDLLVYIQEQDINSGSKSSVNFVEIGAASGIVSLLFAAILEKLDSRYEITAIEPNLSNMDFLETASINNNLQVKILPLAIGFEDGWISFVNDGTRGLVGDAAQNLPEHKKHAFKYSKPIINADALEGFISEPDVFYIDAFLNEHQIIEELIPRFTTLKHLIVEFDNGISERIEKLLNKHDFTMVKKINYHYLFSKVTPINAPVL